MRKGAHFVSETQLVSLLMHMHINIRTEVFLGCPRFSTNLIAVFSYLVPQF